MIKKIEIEWVAEKLETLPEIKWLLGIAPMELMFLKHMHCYKGVAPTELNLVFL